MAKSIKSATPKTVSKSNSRTTADPITETKATVAAAKAVKSEKTIKTAGTAKKSLAAKTIRSSKATAQKAPTKTTAKKSTAAASKEKLQAKDDAAKNLQAFYEDGLKDMYWAETALLKALPKMEKNASSSKLIKAIQKHTKETSKHIERLESCFAEIGMKPKAEKCDAMDGLLKEGEGIMEETELGAVRDVGIIAAAQKVEHYEIASYGTLAAFAKVLGHNNGLKMLLKNLNEEKACDLKLTQIADTALNSKAE